MFYILCQLIPEKPGVLQSMGLQRVGHNQVTELNWIPVYIEFSMGLILLFIVFAKPCWQQGYKSVLVCFYSFGSCIIFSWAPPWSSNTGIYALNLHLFSEGLHLLLPRGPGELKLDSWLRVSQATQVVKSYPLDSSCECGLKLHTFRKTFSSISASHWDWQIICLLLPVDSLGGGGLHHFS